MTLLLVGDDGPIRDDLERALCYAAPRLRVLPAASAGKAVVLLDELLVDCVMAMRSPGSGSRETAVRRWMSQQPGLCEIPFLVVAAGAESVDPAALRWALGRHGV